MHRNGYKGRKLGRERDQRRALIKNLANSLVEHGSIETTLPKAKEVLPYMEKLITKAKVGDLHNRRLIIKSLTTLESAHKLVDEIAPKLTSRDSGHLRIVRTSLRRGDNAQLATVSFVDDITASEEKPKKASTANAEPKKETKPAVKAKKAKPMTKKEAK